MIVLAVRAHGHDLIVTVAPITHRPPAPAARAVELPTATKRRLGLDDARSWIVTDDLNRFVWPGPDLRPLPGRPATFAYGLIPTGAGAGVENIQGVVEALAWRAHPRLPSHPNCRVGSDPFSVAPC